MQACKTNGRKHFEHLAFYPLTICINREREFLALCFAYHPFITYIFSVTQTKHIHQIICLVHLWCELLACSVCLTRVTRESFPEFVHIERCCSFGWLARFCFCSRCALFCLFARSICFDRLCRPRDLWYVSSFHCYSLVCVFVCV